MIKINNIQKYYSYPLIQLRGCVHRSIKSDKIHICVNSETNYCPIIKFNFKILVHLKKKVNKTNIWIESELNNRIFELKLNLIFKQNFNEKIIRIVYLICGDSVDNIFENGFFQSPESEDNSIGSAINRIALNVLLSQCFFAQTLPNNKTFNLELNQNNYPKVYVFKLNLTIDKIWSLDSHQLWKLVAQQLMSSVLAGNHFKYLAFSSFTRYSSNSMQSFSPKYSDLLHNVKGYSALGGGGLAMLGTACLYTWATHLNDINNRFNDQRLVDRNFFMDDSFNRGFLWSCYSTTLGAMVHELAHILDLGHSQNGIMGLDFHFIKSFFVMESDSQNEIKWWNSSEICILSNHKWINDYKVCETNDSFIINSNIIKSKFGIIAVEYRHPINEKVVKRQTFTLPAKCLRLDPMRETFVFAIDSNGNTIKFNLENALNYI